MRRMGIIGLCIAAFTVATAVAATAASALPEYKTLSSPFPVTYTSVNMAESEPRLNTSIMGTTVHCKASKGTGEILSATTVSKVKTNYTECREEGTSNTCTTAGQASGAIVTKELKGRIGYVLPLTGKVTGTELEPSTGSLFMEFTCTGAAGKVTFEGCTIAETTITALLFEENAAKNAQKWTEIGGGTHKPCELSATATILKLKGKGWIMDQQNETFSGILDLLV